MPQNNDVIAAIATPPGSGGIGIIRISGDNLTTILTNILGSIPTPRLAAFSSFFDVDGSLIDKGIAIYFKGPNSYTGEDVLELQAHGGIAVLQLLLARCLVEGVRIAKPGEFTQRAFLNNKIDLVQAEGIADLINAKSKEAVKSANRSLKGEFSKAINILVSDIINLRIYLEASIDFPEEEIDTEDVYRNEVRLQKIFAELDKIFRCAKQGSILREGANIVLVGQPNVGKSSLLNVLAGEDVALVSEIAGTTRDSIRQLINIEGVPFNIVDTAGIRDSCDVIELMGMDRTKQVIKTADIVLLLTESPWSIQNDMNSILQLIPENIYILKVLNKADIWQEQFANERLEDSNVISISAKTGLGIDKLKNKILEALDWTGEEGVYIARERHIQALSVAKEYLVQASTVLFQTELFAEYLTLSQIELSKITGEFSSEDLLGEIFNHFCIGK